MGNSHKKTLTILGSTGSIGCQTLEVARHLDIRVRALSADKNIDLLEEQIREFSPELVAVFNENAAKELRTRFRGSSSRVTGTIPRIVSGMESQTEAARKSGADVIVTAIAGQAGLEPTIAALKTGRRVALANKEPLVCAGETVMQTARKYGTEIIPVDSEHSAIFQCLQGFVAEASDSVIKASGEGVCFLSPTQAPPSPTNHNLISCSGEKKNKHPHHSLSNRSPSNRALNSNNNFQIKKLILTASGGPFRGKTRSELKNITPELALKHPNWNMGKKITIDSATLMNKGLELIEAMHLFGVDPDRIEILIHPQSIIHSMVEFADGCTMAQLSNPDMRQPIQYALTYPDRVPSLIRPLDLTEIKSLTFEKPDMDSFPCLRLAYEAAKKGTKACAALNQANEEAVELFLRGKIGFNEIPEMIESALQSI